MSEEEAKKEEIEITVECAWRLSPQCWGKWTTKASPPFKGITSSICPPCDLIQAERDKAVLKKRKENTRKKIGT